MSFYVTVIGAPTWPDCYWSPEKNTTLNDANMYTAVLPKYQEYDQLDNNAVGGLGRTLRIYVTLVNPSSVTPWVSLSTQVEGVGKYIAQRTNLDTLVVQDSMTQDCLFFAGRPDLYDGEQRSFLSNAYITRVFSSFFSSDALGRSASVGSDGVYYLDWWLGHGVVMSGVDYYIKTDTSTGRRLWLTSYGTIEQTNDTDSTTYFRFDHCDGTMDGYESTTYSVKAYNGKYVCVNHTGGVFVMTTVVVPMCQFTLMPSPTQDGRMIFFTQYPTTTAYIAQRFWAFSAGASGVWASTLAYTGNAGFDAMEYSHCFDIHPVVAG